MSRNSFLKTEKILGRHDTLFIRPFSCWEICQMYSGLTRNTCVTYQNNTYLSSLLSHWVLFVSFVNTYLFPHLTYNDSIMNELSLCESNRSVFSKEICIIHHQFLHTHTYIDTYMYEKRTASRWKKWVFSVSYLFRKQLGSHKYGNSKCDIVRYIFWDEEKMFHKCCICNAYSLAQKSDRLPYFIL